MQFRLIPTFSRLNLTFLSKLSQLNRTKPGAHRGYIIELSPELNQFHLGQSTIGKDYFQVFPWIFKIRAT